MIDAVLRVVGRHAVLYDAVGAGEYDESWFDRRAWKARGARAHSLTGRGGVLILPRGEETWVLRHYQRGGFVARFVVDHYLWLGLERSRSFREWRLLAQLCGEGFPVPRPIAAHVLREGPAYQADIVTAYLADTRSLSSYLADQGAPPNCWPEIGRMLRRFHDRGVDHPDLTAHNVLLDGRGDTFLVDFDNACVRAPGAWRYAGVARFERSLRKVALETGTRFDLEAWHRLVAAYEAGSGR